MAVELIQEDDDRLYRSIKWDFEKVKGEIVEIHFENPDDPENDSWTRALTSDKRAVVSFPAGYAGTVKVTVAGDEGTADSGTITI